MIDRLFKGFGFGNKKEWWERYFVLILVVCAIVFMAISLIIGLQQSVWFDEAYSIMVAKQPAEQLVHLTALDTHPPLYYLLLKGWATLFGWSEFALRSLSVLAAGGAIVFAGLLARRMFGVRVALVTLPFLVLSPFLLRYGFEIRMYALGSLIGVAATYVLVRALQTKAGREQWLLYGIYAVLVALGVYALYYTVLLWLAHFVWLVWQARQQKQPVVSAPWFRAFLLSVVLFLPWLPAFISQVGNGALAAISQPMTIDNLVGIVSFAFVYQPTWQLNAFVSLLVLFVIVTLTYLTVRAFKNVPGKQRQYLVLLAMYMAVPVIILTIVSLARPMYVERYLAHITIGGALFVGAIASFGSVKKNAKVAAAVCGLVVVLTFGVVHLAGTGNFNFQRLQSPMVKQAAATITDCGQDSKVFAADPYVAIELAYYLPDCQIYFHSDTVELRGGYAPLSNSPLHIDDPAKELATSRKVYYVYYDQPTKVMPVSMQEKGVTTFDALKIATFSAE